MKNYKTTFDERTKIWCGQKLPRTYKATSTIGQAVLEVMQKNGKKIAQICHHNGKEYNYEELAKMSKNAANYFRKLQLQQGDVIGLCGANTDLVAPLFFGAMLKGLIVSPLDVSYAKDDIRHCFGITKPKIAFVDGGVYEKVKKALEECGNNIEIYTMKDHIEGVKTIHEVVQAQKANDEDFSIEPLKAGGMQTAVVLCSSGTTGLPKGVTMSHEDLLNAFFIDLESEDRFLCFSSLSWFSGLYALLWGTLTGLTRIIHANGFSADNLLDIVEKYQVTVLLTPPSQLALTLTAPKLQTANLASVRLYCLAGSSLTYALVKQIKPYYPNATFLNAYGMSEARTATAGGVCVEASGHIGQLAPNCMYKILANDELAGEKQLGTQEIGELFFKNPYKWLGYYGNAEATAATLTDDGWIRTGDLAYFDDSGNLFIVDRKKDILKYQGFQYFPTEIEHVIYELDDVLEVCVCGLPDLISTDLPAAAVVKKACSNLTEVQICEHVAQRMANFKHLRGGVYFLEQLPKTSTGKILRKECKSICEKLRKETFLK